MRQVVDGHDNPVQKPLTEPVFFILASLAAQPRHGYALLRDIRELSKERVQLSTGTLYGALRRLLEDGWIVRFEQEDTSRDKQAYRLAGEGRRQLEAEVERLKFLTRAAASQLKANE